MSMPAAAEPRPARWQQLTKAECFELLANEHLGRVAVVDDLGPVLFPVNLVFGTCPVRPPASPSTPGPYR